MPRVWGRRFRLAVRQGGRGLFELLSEGVDNIFFVEAQKTRVLPREIAGKYAARKTVELVRFNRLEKVQADLKECVLRSRRQTNRATGILVNSMDLRREDGFSELKTDH